MQAGIKVDLIIRGICNLVPGVKGMSENIQVRSVLGRYLEHSRIYYFQNAKKESPAIFAGSADLMPRNFYCRIEALFSSTRARTKNALNIHSQTVLRGQQRRIQPTGEWLVHKTE